ncbi:MAG: hypothetical protein ACE5H4_10260 [Candidatus Thorarchaeota archaeon]
MRITDRVGLLQSIGLDLSAKEMRILRAVLSAAGGLSRSVSAKEVWKHVIGLDGKNVSEAWVYRKLSELVENEFVVVDRIERPIRYMVTNDSIISALEQCKNAKLSELATAREKVMEEVGFLRSIDVKKLSKEMRNTLTGNVLSRTSGVVEGIDYVRGIIHGEILDVAGPGDVIRTLNPLVVLERGPPQSSATDRRLLETTFRGVTLKALNILMAQPEGAGLALLTRFISNLSETFHEAIRTERLELRALPPGTRSYRMLSLNDEIMMLYLTDVAAADTAALVYKKDNPKLIEDAIKTFERLWEQAHDISAVLTQKMSTGTKLKHDKEG